MAAERSRLAKEGTVGDGSDTCREGDSGRWRWRAVEEGSDLDKWECKRISKERLKSEGRQGRDGSRRRRRERQAHYASRSENSFLVFLPSAYRIHR